MDDLTESEYEAAVERGRIEFETLPHARSARFDRASGKVTVELYNGCTFMFPARQVQGLEDASDDELAEVEVMGVGYGLGWDTRDVHFTVHGLMEGRFGTAAYMAPIRARLHALLDQDRAEHRDAA